MSKTEAAQGQLDKWIVREGLTVWRALATLDMELMEEGMDGLRIDKLTVRAPRAGSPDFLIAVGALTADGRRFIAFRSGASLREALIKVAQDREAGTLQFREEKPYNPG